MLFLPRNGRQGTELLKRGVLSSLSCSEKFSDMRLAVWNTKENSRLTLKNCGFEISGQANVRI
jgi:hypothetical protein